MNSELQRAYPAPNLGTTAHGPHRQPFINHSDNLLQLARLFYIFLQPRLQRPQDIVLCRRDTVRGAFDVSFSAAHQVAEGLCGPEEIREDGLQSRWRQYGEEARWRQVLRSVAFGP